MCDLAGILDSSGKKVECLYKGACPGIHPDAGSDLLALGPQVTQDHFSAWRCPLLVKTQLATALGRPDLHP
jgi:hypothetical protein